MMNDFCEMCLTELEEPGGILFGPPDFQGLVKKTHLCVKCYTQVKNFTVAKDALKQLHDVTLLGEDAPESLVRTALKVANKAAWKALSDLQQ